MTLCVLLYQYQRDVYRQPQWLSSYSVCFKCGRPGVQFQAELCQLLNSQLPVEYYVQIQPL